MAAYACARAEAKGHIRVVHPRHSLSVIAQPALGQEGVRIITEDGLVTVRDPRVDTDDRLKMGCQSCLSYFSVIGNSLLLERSGLR